MNTQRALLQPFRTAAPMEVRIGSEASRQGNRLAVCYHLLGSLSELAIPPPAAPPARKNALWKTTCFEFFLAVAGLDSYWEFNLSPAGHWNVYRFLQYRKAMQEETAFAALPVEVQKKPDALRLSVEIDLDPIVERGKTLNIGVSAVIETGKRELTYWALAHFGPRPDFHRREGFLLEV